MECDIDTPRGELEFEASCKGFWSGIFGGRCAGAPARGDRHCASLRTTGGAWGSRSCGRGAGDWAGPSHIMRFVSMQMAPAPTPAWAQCAGFTSAHTEFKDFDSYKFCAGKHGMFVKRGKRGFAVGGGCKGKALAALQLTEDEDDDSRSQRANFGRKGKALAALQLTEVEDDE